MTRFARAKGSKASNEKLPNEATPWHLMKQQLEENKHKPSLEKKISVKELLNTHSSNINENTDWAEFDDKSNLSNNTQKHEANKIHETLVEHSQNDNTDHILENNKTKNLKTQDTEIRTVESKKNTFSKEKQNLDNLLNEKQSNTSQNNECSNSILLSKRQKRNRKRKLEMINNNVKRFKNDRSSHSKTKEERIKEKGEYKRRKPDNGATKMMINGVEIEIVKYDGFPIKKEDADRLAELKQKMIIKGEFI